MFFSWEKVVVKLKKNSSDWNILVSSAKPLGCWNSAQLMYMFPCSIFSFLSAGCQIMSSRRSCVYLVYKVKGSFSLISHHGEFQILFSMIIVVLLDRGRSYHLTGWGNHREWCCACTALVNWGAAKKPDRWSETQMESSRRDSTMYMDPSVFGQASFQSDSWWLFYSCFLSFYSSLQICHEGKSILFC